MTARSESRGDMQLGLADTLRQSGSCLGQLAHTLLELEDCVLAAADPSSSTAAETRTLQSLDYIKQATDDIAGLLLRLAESVPDTATVSRNAVIEPMKLQALRRRIAQDISGEKIDRTLFEGKEIELF